VASRVYLLSYDIRDPRRLRSMHKVATAYGIMLQYSVYACALTRAQRIQLKGRVQEVIDHAVDQVIILDLGAVRDEGSWIPPYESLGLNVNLTVRRSVVV